MRHKTIQKKLLRYLDNDLSEKEKEEWRRHLESCRNCRDALKTVEALWKTEQPIERKKAPQFLWTSISARLKTEQKQGFLNRVTNNIVRPALRPVAIVVVLLFIFFIGIQLGTLMSGQTGDGAEISSVKESDDFGLGYFEVLPPTSLYSHTLALIESEIKK